MAAPLPKGHRPQFQSMTVALRNICRDYPGGTGVLRELLQNADDAGASGVRFVLDLTNYPCDHLLHPDLARYQGPALLAYNSAIFSEEDFISLSRIGDSRKFLDGSATGKFGRGFNSVYNWTDSPSIVSESTLLILDPHHGWSASFKDSTPGGPTYDFVAHAESIAMNNQMSAFSSILTDFEKPYQGTIIRIPLRTELQAMESEICGRPTSASDIEEVLKKFSSEFGSFGLLFLKNVESIKIEIGKDVLFHMTISNSVDVRRNKQLVNEAMRLMSKGETKSLDLTFEIEIETASTVAKSRTSFAVHHSIADYPEDKELQDWCKAQAMVPWIAVAAQIPVDTPDEQSGSLFTVLPLPVLTNQPVHIHGLFSLSTDRSRLHRSSDGNVQDQLPILWNEWLFDVPIPLAWVNLLLFLAKRYPNKSAFARWPLTHDSLGSSLNGMIEKLLQIVHEKSSKLWYTDLGYTGADMGVLANGDESSDLRKALCNAQIPVIYMPDKLLSYVQGYDLIKGLNPLSLCYYLERNSVELRVLSDTEKQILLEYVLSDSTFREYGKVELFPFEDGTYKTIENKIAFVHRNELEQSIFTRDGHKNINLYMISSKTKQTLMKGLLQSSLHSSFRQRSSSDLKTYCLDTYFKEVDQDADDINLSEDAEAFVSRVWDWVVTRNYTLSNADLASLWLVPLSNGQYRKVKPQHLSSRTIYAPPGEMGDFLRKMANVDIVQNKPILLSDKFSSPVLQLFMSSSKDLSIYNGGDLKDFVLWLKSIGSVVEKASDDDKVRLQELLVSYRHLCSTSTTISDTLRDLRIFRKVTWPTQNGTEPSFSWTSLESSSQIVGLRGLVPVPKRSDVLFLDARSEIMTRLLTEYKLGKCHPILQLLREYIIPYWQNGALEALSAHCREEITRLLVRRFFDFDKSTQSILRTLPFIPVVCINGKSRSKFAAAAELIDSSNQLLRSLFFDDEEVYPTGWIISDYKGVLIQCGLQASLTEELVTNRITRFGNDHDQIEPAWERSRILLQSKIEWAPNPSYNATSIQRNLHWLPAVNPCGTKILSSATLCRGFDDKLLVGLILPVVDFDIEKKWKQRLGWYDTISHDILLSQLQKGIEQKNRKIVNAVLDYILRSCQIDALHEPLVKLRCVLTQKDCFVNPEKSFRKGCERLGPYLQNVDNSFWLNHRLLLERLGVRLQPDIECLLCVQKELVKRVPLNETDREVAIEIIKLASVFDRKQLSALMIVTAAGNLCAIDEVTFNDLGLLSSVQGTVSYTHRDIPDKIIQRLCIEPLSERIQKGQLGLTDVDDEDEFDQREDVATGIANTLERYPVESTFKEYLANADDAESATCVEWLLDARQHPQVNLVTKELSAYQGASLIVHNNGVFLEKDFEGFKHVGRGSKREDASTIGKFGRGSQTMYHWTDVPMLLSGKDLLILDPLQQVLPMNYRKGHRKSGIRMPLSKLKTVCPDQLAPFEGLFGYSRELDYFPGTIFRFPLRPGTVQSRLRESNAHLDYTAVRNYLTEFFDEARISLLFLRRVRSMEFKIHGENHPRWSIRSSRGRLDSSFSDWTICSVEKGNGLDIENIIEDRWWTAIQDPPELPTELLHRHKRTMKDVECGIAALVDSTDRKAMKTVPAPKPRVFSTLPLPFSLELPIYLHATFLTTGDRQSVVIENSAREAGADWNRWVLASAIPALYLAFLDDLGRKIGQDIFRFWPIRVPPKGFLSDLVYTSFWQQLPKTEYRLFPLARQQDKTKKRQPPKLLEMKDATFDLLPNDVSLTLRPILESQIPTLVRVPFDIGRKLRTLEPKMQIVTPSILRNIFRSETATECLMSSGNIDKIMEVLLKEIIPMSSADSEELNGCRVLPLLDGTFGTLSVKSLQKSTVTYYLVNKIEKILFNFASQLLTIESQGTEFKHALLKDQKFNIKTLDLSDIGMLLNQKDFSVDRPESDFDSWLRYFWEYWCGCEVHQLKLSEEMFFSTSGICNYPLLQATCDGVKTYLKPAELKSFPSIVEPEDERQQKFCNRFSGLYRLNALYMPGYLKITETSLQHIPSFVRLIKSLSLLAANQNKHLENYIKSVLGTAELEILRDLVCNYLNAEPNDQYTINGMLQQLPIWPSVTLSNPLLTAISAKIAMDYSLVVPWMNEYAQFIQSEAASSYKKVLKLLRVQEIANTAILKFYILAHLPQKITLEEETSYKSFINAVARVCAANHQRKKSKESKNEHEQQVFLDLLRSSRLALDGNRVLQSASTLFDHDDAIFEAAFREEAKTRFLSTQVQRNRQFWVDVGLRCTTTKSNAAEDYILCLKTMHKRLDARGVGGLDDQLASDIAIVLKPLTRPGMTSQYSFSPIDWKTIQKEAVFPVLTTFNSEPTYRRKAMTTLAVLQTLLPLEDAIDQQYKAICWSQTAFPSTQPSGETFGKIASGGKPPVSMVWRHLKHLMESVESLTEGAVSDFLSDLTRTYDFLQDNLETACEAFTDVTSPLWLNLEETNDLSVKLEDLRSSWMKIEHLVLLSSCDSPPLMSVQSRLMRHERLLKALGCRQITYPTIVTPVISTAESLSAGMSRLRLNNKLLDITLTAEDGQSLRAHKLVLAAVSDYFTVQFSGRWSDDSTVSLPEIAFATLSTLVDFAYADAASFDWTPLRVTEADPIATIADKLDALLDLLTAANFLLMPALHQRVEQEILSAGRKFMRIENVLDIRERAQQAKAQGVEEMCDKFYQKNDVPVNLVYAERRKDGVSGSG